MASAFTCSCYVVQDHIDHIVKMSHFWPKILITLGNLVFNRNVAGDLQISELPRVPLKLCWKNIQEAKS
jgi:hypothetical protein